MSLEVIEPGLSTTVQDLGRPGHYHLGFPLGGSMDQESALLANALVGNTPDAAVLECTYIGPRLRAINSVAVAVTGAPVDVKLNGADVPQWHRLQLSPGDELSFGLIKAGMTFSIAVRGGVDVPISLGSRSTYSIGRIGGVEGRAIAVGDLIPVGRATMELPRGASVPSKDRPRFEPRQDLRVVLGLYDHLLTSEGLRRLLESDWTLTPNANRMGLRLQGPGVEWQPRVPPFGAGQDPSNIVDAGYAMGSIQIPGGTQPIVLHRDAVSGGGYAMVATVISADLDLLARARPGDAIHFSRVSLTDALVVRAHRSQRINKIASNLHSSR
ncbi:MAG: biotin-dependent carboxyltransferase [Actinobacteria bacterium]|nr:biotin-dependent carboxyltransferase [Actinomycetota bacterium]